MGVYYALPLHIHPPTYTTALTNVNGAAHPGAPHHTHHTHTPHTPHTHTHHTPPL